MKLSVEKIEFVKELYPRLREDDAAIERYRAALDRLPPIVVARKRVLVDGFHRWQAHRREGSKTVEVEDLGNLTDAEIIRESISRNAAHGQQLSNKDKQRLAGKLWLQFADMGGARTAEIAELLSVSERSIQTWTKDARKSEKKEQQDKAWDLWLDCQSYRDIATDLDISKSEVERMVSHERKSADTGQPPKSRQHFDVWSFQTAAGESSYFGKMPPQVVENLLWLFTEPGDIVVDPFAGGGTTIDVAKEMGRRVWASDIEPSTPNLPIHEYDITTGWPDAPQAQLALLDPPYWQQSKGRYTDKDTDLSNLDLDAFNETWGRVAKAAMDNADRVAYIISPTQLEDGSVVDHATDMLVPFRDNGWRVERRIIVTYNTQQATGQQVEWAREKKYLLKLYRDLVVVGP